ncbi:hypothetical protein HEP84_12310 [Streptomyces sp. RLB1-33]|uniref:hypothetical protein n=1 Tax=Streptomyces mirabilis TaxID=68239 RepID=UPI00143EE017|nr:MULTISPECIES: hypothetical protein [Streptomyces]QIY69821.1 hypothetical protein HEP84_12310 [Streptomyces sp. RLB1-33]QUW83309.1 hypothetical protein SMIR_32600 [Streptomyces mirabilis]
MTHRPVPVEPVVEGTPRPLAPGVEQCAYRDVQEALTNVLKYAGLRTRVWHSVTGSTSRGSPSRTGG